MALSRRALLTLGLIGGGYVALNWRGAALMERVAGLPDLIPLAEPVGFRKLEGGDLSGGTFDPFIGLDEGAQIVAEPVRRDTLCAALFGADDDGSDAVPIAYFTDYACPYCRVLGDDLTALQAEMPDRVRLIWHELPLLGPPSVLGARAALAAAKQGAYLPFHKRLNTGIVRITDAFIDQIAEDLGLDQATLRRDMADQATTQRLATSKGVADLFGVIGTPFLVIGRTAISGRISSTRLRQLVDLERAEGLGSACA